MILRRRFTCGVAAAAAGFEAARANAEGNAVSSGAPKLPWALTLSSAENHRFETRVREALRQISRALAGKLLLPVDSAAQVDPSSGRRAVVHALVVIDGELRGFWSNWPPGVLRPGPEGSMSKTLGLIALAPRHPYLVSPQATWIAQPLAGMREADGTRGGGSLSALEAVSRSRNLPAAWAFGQIGDRALRASLSASGIQIPPGYPAAVSVAYGHLQWSPMQVVTLFDSLASGSARGVRLSRDQVRTSALASWAARSLDAARGSADDVRALLAGPVLHPRGTARHLKDALVGLNPIAKTGTAVNRAFEDVAKVLTLSFRPRPGRTATVYAAMTAPRLDQPLGTSLPTSAFAPLHRSLIDYAKEISS